MKKAGLLLSLIPILMAAKGVSQSGSYPASDSIAINKCLTHYFVAGEMADPTELGKAFYPGAIMFWADSSSRMSFRTQKQWKTLLSQQKVPDKAIRRDIRILALQHNIAIAGVESLFPDKTYYDYIALVRSRGNWNIVSKVFTKKITAENAPKKNDPSDIRQVQSLLETKFKAMNTNDPDLLASAYYPRAMSYYVDDDQLVGVSIQEWIARFEFDRRNNTPVRQVDRKIEMIDCTGPVGFAKFTHSSEISVVTDLVLLLKLENRWRIINLAFTSAGK